MKKIFIPFLANLLILSAIPMVGLAADLNGDGIDDSTGLPVSGGTGTGFIPTPDTSMTGTLGAQRFVQAGSMDDMLNTTANYVIGILIVVAIFYILWAAYTFVTSAGSDEKVSEARKRIMFAAIGIIVALLTRGIVSLVLAVAKPATNP